MKQLDHLPRPCLLALLGLLGLVPLAGSPALAAQDDGQYFESTADPDLESTEGGTTSNPDGGDEEEDQLVTWGVSGGDIYQFRSSIDGGGSFSVNRAFLAGGFEYAFSPSLTLDFDLGFEADSYVFNGGGAFADAAGGVPWTTALDVTLAAAAHWNIDDTWRFVLKGFVSWAGEHDAEVGRSFTGGGNVGVAYTFSDELTLGVGALIAAQLEDDVLFIPSPVVDWRISERLFMSNVRGPVNYPTSSGLELIYYLSYELNVSVGARYELRRFRLNDDGSPRTRNGVGQERSIPLWVRLEWRPMDKLRIHLLAGCSFWEQLQISDSGGRQLDEQNVDPAPFIGCFVGFEF